jgi:hypothetical protein
LSLVPIFGAGIGISHALSFGKLPFSFAFSKA